jgi:hypothetical protein
MLSAALVVADSLLPAPEKAEKLAGGEVSSNHMSRRKKITIIMLRE